MKFSIVAILFAGLVTSSLSLPAGLILGYQDTLGQYSFGYSAPHQARSEVRSLDGVTRGSYSYVDGAGLVQSTEYTADGENGFRVSATNLPQAPSPVQDTPEVVAARKAHLLAVEEATRVAIGTPNDQSDDSVSITAAAKSSLEPEIIDSEKETSPPVLPAEPIIEAVAEAEEMKEEKEEEAEESAGEIQTPEALAEAAAWADAAEEEALKKKMVEDEAAAAAAAAEVQPKGRAVEESAIPQESLPVPSISLNFDLPVAITRAYSGRPADAKAETTLPQSTPVQGAVTPAGTTLKSLPSPQLVSVVPQISVASEPNYAPSVVAARGLPAFYDETAAGSVFGPTGPVNLIRFLGYDPTISSFYRYAPIPYVTYNIV